MNAFIAWFFVIALSLTVGVAADLATPDSVMIDVEVVPGYHSCTRAVDMRCDFYYEYEGANLINQTNTWNCFYLSEFEGCP